MQTIHGQIIQPALLIIQTGTSYIYNGVLPKTIYVRDPTPLATRVVGHSTVPDCFAPTAGNVYFELYTTVTITSFELRLKSAGSSNVSIQNAAGTITYWGPTTITGAANQIFTPAPNVTLGPGLYRFFTSVSDQFCRNQMISPDGGRDWLGVMNVTGENNGLRGGSFYNIGVSLPDPCGIRAYTVVDGCPLPVNLLQFNGIRNGNVSKLSWITSSEQNSSHFIVQRSLDGINYSDIATVGAAGNSNNMRKYSATDYMPSQGTNYYRLVQYDMDGTAHISEVVVVNMSGANILVAPNPFTGDTKVQFPDNIKASISVLDVLGRIVFEYEKEGNENAVIVGSDLASGSYVLRIVSEAGVNNFMVIKE